MSTPVLVETDGPVGRITLDRPEKLNPLSPQTLADLADSARRLDDEREVKVIVISGRGRAFSAGADVAAFGRTDIPPRDAADLGRRMADAIEAMRAVTIARIHGHCVGGGVVLASACDVRIAADTTRFSIPEIDLGIPLAWGGVPRLVRDLGPVMAKELVMTGRAFDAAEAKAIGFINRVVPDADLDAAVDEMVATLAAKASGPLAATKRHVNAVADGMVGAARAWNDADSLVAARADAESQAAAADYMARLRR